jgi:long-subunit fatty acid transport protein
MKKVIFTLALWSSALLLSAQSHVDALRYSQHSIGGTARSVAMQGAFGALGGDFSTLSSNPAGLGVYRSSEFTFTPEFYQNNTTARYFGNEVEEGKFNFNISNLGYVANFENGGVLKDINFGIGFNRLANFNRNTVIQGVNQNTSLGHFMAGSANAFGLETFSSALFWDAFLIDYDTTIGYYLTEDPELGYYDPNTGAFYPTEQRIIHNEKGRTNEWTFSLGMNISDVLYFGTTLGWHTVNYDSERIFKEYDASSPDYLYFTYNENLKVRGDGFAAKIGVIFRPLPMLRIGAAFHSPVFYSLKEEYSTNISSVFIDYDVYKPLDENGREIDYLENKYKVTTPAKLIGSAAITLGRFLIVSSDVEYIDYSSMRLKPSTDFDIANEEIGVIYKDALNVKMGSELRLGKAYFRGGVGFYGSPFAELEENENAYRISYSGGLGFRDSEFFFDIAYQYVSYDQREILYQVNLDGRDYAPAANIDSKAHRVMTTIGFRF